MKLAPPVLWGWLITLAALGARADQTVLHMPIGDPERRETEVPLVLDGITAAADGELISPQELAARLADTRLLLVGENHTNEDFHRVQYRVIEALHAAGREVLIGLEMFPHTRQSYLDGWSRGHYTEQGFVELADWYEYWGHDFAYYRDIFRFALDHGIRMFGVNAPREVVSAVRRKGFDELTEDEARHVPTRVDVDSDEHRRMYRAFFDDDDAMHGVLNDEIFEGMFRAQCTWDAAMGWNAVQALREHGGPGAIMVVLVGAGHVTYGLGIERQTAPRYEGEIASVVPVPVATDEGEAVQTVRASYADFIWGVPQQRAPVRPLLGVSLMGAIGKEPTKIIRVEKRSVGQRAGLAVGDVILSLDDVEVSSGKDLRRGMAAYEWGDVIAVELQRNGKSLRLDVPLRRVTQ